jgi:predicted PurR-regulated permease PerM
MPPAYMNTPQLQQKTFLFLLIAVSLAFGMILLPFYGAVFWGTVLAILFAPFYRRVLKRTNQSANWAALVTLFVCLVIVILPVAILALSLIKEATLFYERLSSNELNFGSYFQTAIASLPRWAVEILDRFGLADLPSLLNKLTQGAMQSSQTVAKQVVSFGQNAFGFVVSLGIMLYLLFFLLRDGITLRNRILDAIPLSTEHKRHLFSKFTTVIRATVKGNIAVAATQGMLGGLIFWFLDIQGALLWAVLMAFLSLLPAVGAGLVWGPVAVYFLLSGAIWQGVTLILFCVFVIGLVDNIMRPILVGKDTQMPDYVVLISTLGGIAIFGLNGFVIGPVIAALFIASWDLFISVPKSEK